jgi:hypothetical protein
MAFDVDAHPLLKPGDKIRLNENAKEWTRGKVFTVASVKKEVVICSTTSDGYGDGSTRQSRPHTTRASGNLAFYRAPWEEIEGLA